MKKLLLSVLTLAEVLIPAAGLSPARAETPDDSHPVSAAAVDQSVSKAVAWIEAQQTGDNWERVPLSQGREKWDHVEYAQWGGLTALATLTLLEAGVGPSDPHVAAAVKFLESANLIGNYALALRARVWPLLPRSPEVVQAAQADLVRMFSAMKTEKEARGFYHYYIDENKGTDYDHSVAAYIANAVAGEEEMGFEVPTNYWEITEAAWRRDQMPDGGWPYVKEGDTTMTMTTSGVDVLFITQDALRRNLGLECRPLPVDPGISKGLAWIGDNLAKAFDTHILPQFALANYSLYYLSRIANVAGVKYFNKVDWYAAGAAQVVSKQQPNGYWGDPNNNLPQYHLPDTCLAVLFLATGRAPVMMEKLQYDQSSGEKSARPAPAAKDQGGAQASSVGEAWDERPRDVANAVHWSGKQMEAQLSWQVVNWDLSTAELHDSNILYISGNRALKPTPEQMEKLKAFMNEGGLVLANADCGNEAFSLSIRQMAKTIYPDYAFRTLPEKHPIFTDEQFPRRKWGRKMTVMGLSNGVRELMILLPNSDVGRAYQMQQTEQHLEAFQFGSDLYQYMGGRDHPRNKGDRYTVAPDPAKTPTHNVKIARLQFGGNWNPEPAGWSRLGAVLHNDRDIALNITIVPVGTGKLDSTYQLAVLTGTGPLELSAGCRNELKTYVEHGGTVLIDAAGGDSAFATAVEAQLRLTFPMTPLQPIPAEDGLFTKAPAMDRIRVTKFGMKSLGSIKTPQFKGIQFQSRWGVIYSPFDISCGLVGNDVDGVMGYDPDSSVRLAERVIDAVASPNAAAPTNPG